jgi:predicted nuclease of predicted toxin-antitoxin system
VRWLVDESVDAILATDLREAGHDVTYVAEVDPRAIDLDILTRAQRENRILLTP